MTKAGFLKVNNKYELTQLDRIINIYGMLVNTAPTARTLLTTVISLWCIRTNHSHSPTAKTVHRWGFLPHSRDEFVITCDDIGEIDGIELSVNPEGLHEWTEAPNQDGTGMIQIPGCKHGTI